MICTHCSKRKSQSPVLCPCKIKCDPHVICTDCAHASDPTSITAVNAAWVDPLSRQRIERTMRVLGDLMFRVEPWGRA